MKKHLFVLTGLFALLASTPQTSRAQDPPPARDQESRKPRTPDEVAAMLDGKLSLSDDQKAKIQQIVAERQQRIRELMDTSGRRRRRGRQIKSIYEESDHKIMALLNNDQKQKYKEIQKQMREHARQRRHDRGSN